LWAAAILAVSVTLRTLDMALCDRIVIEGRKIGTHFAWHVLNGLALFLLLRASLEGHPEAVREAGPAAPEAEAEAEEQVDEAESPSAGPLPLTERVPSLAGGAARKGVAPEEAGSSQEEEPDKTLLPA
jgi:hypothetical protein